MMFSEAWAFFLWGLVAAGAALAVAAFRAKQKAFKTLGDHQVLAKLFPPEAGPRQRLKAVMQLAGLALLVAAMAGPRWGQKFEEVQRRGIDVVIAVDVSASMLAEDIKPNRLEQAKRELGLLIRGLQGDRVGVVAFAGTAFLQCPLTLDYSAARLILDALGPDLIPVPGTSLASALDASADAFPDKERQHKALVLLTDGEDHSEKLDQAMGRAKAEGLRIFAIGYGNPAGEIIPVRDEAGNVVDYKKDKAGKTVVSKLGEETLQRLARETGGRYYRATAGEVEVDRVLEDIHRMDKKNLESRLYDRFENRYLWFLWAAFLLLFLEFLWPETRGLGKALAGAARKKWAVKIPAKALPLLLTGLIFYPQKASAWGRSPQRTASQDPATQFNTGNRLYQDKDFPAAAEAYQSAQGAAKDPALKSRAAYNAGNALFRQNRLDDALEKYKDALRLNPGDMEAKYNLEFTRKMLAEQKKQESQNQNKGEPKDQDKDKNKSGGGDPQQQEQEQEQKSPQPQEAMSKEDLERLMKGLQDQEKETRKAVAPKPPPEKNMEQDW